MRFECFALKTTDGNVIFNLQIHSDLVVCGLWMNVSKLGVFYPEETRVPASPIAAEGRVQHLFGQDWRECFSLFSWLVDLLLVLVLEPWLDPREAVEAEPEVVDVVVGFLLV